MSEQASKAVGGVEGSAVGWAARLELSRDGNKQQMVARVEGSGVGWAVR